MHRTIEITAPPAATDFLISKLEKSDHLIGLTVHRGASIKPPGDVLVVHALNRDADRVMRLADEARSEGQVSVTTHELTSIVDPEHEQEVSKDIDEALWEESETSLRHQGRTTSNYLALMALGGAVAATGFMVTGSSQTISLIAASIIAPGFEPLAKVPMGLALRRWAVVGRGLLSVGVGYLTLALGAALVFGLLRLTGVGTVEEFLGNSETTVLADPTLRDVLLSSLGALAGMIMIVAYRRSVIAGPLIALAIVPAAAMVGIALAAGRPDLAYQGGERFVLDVIIIVLLGTLVVALKQAFTHRRKPMV
ncbi:DUF389 domain-containing protein [Rubrobacter marinus]|uniref:DUF389 domain-containing protein n=1 Tax=Rubrobacter marinus TaxID=2653852 RepID=A0A6G8PVL1_9ACTN|nr:DUF389 domain-containing protein [Rubrobacter marinus]QIN78242.1 DUF389 domain-containing protein [Rubrobacter marinus]